MSWFCGNMHRDQTAAIRDVSHQPVFPAMHPHGGNHATPFRKAYDERIA
ncbi:hypothetical protein RSSM_03668 [Rhodopirellula sallentina SM41]|uniref:Uncharacterized protein n=1 Tax=Rhodopirellula sallentina SM41 TaxID=1263870 RepID=M5UFV3_9BACT|nr:hypothetical protein RSSM_03668 [Rhodopirellula sallentina SM41]